MNNPTTNNFEDSIKDAGARKVEHLSGSDHETLQPKPAPQMVDHLDTLSSSLAASNDACLVPAQVSAIDNSKMGAQRKLVRAAGGRGAEQLLHVAADYDLFHSPEHIGFAD